MLDNDKALAALAARGWEVMMEQVAISPSKRFTVVLSAGRPAIMTASLAARAQSDPPASQLAMSSVPAFEHSIAYVIAWYMLDIEGRVHLPESLPQSVVDATLLAA